MKPPHLPVKTENPDTQRFIQRLKFLLFIVTISVLAGASGASMMLGWIWPRFAEGDMWIASYTRPGLSRAQLENLIREETADRLVSVHRGSVAVGEVNYFNKKIGDGIMLSSDGWLAIYQPEYDGIYKNIYVVGNGGNVYQAASATWDKYSGMLYLKVKDDQFKVVEFVDENASFEDIFVWQDSNWYHGTVLHPVLHYKISHIDSAPVRQYALDSVFQSGQVAINNQGRVAGFITKDSTLLPAQNIARILPKILNKQGLSYPSLGVEGWFSDEQTIFINTSQSDEKERAEGFFVSSVWSSASVLRKGDLIIELNGRIVTVDNLWYIISSAQTVKAKIIRGGKIIELDVKIVQTK